MHRPSILARTSLAIAFSLAAAACSQMPQQSQQPPQAAVMTKAKQAAMTPEAALQLLKEGNERFVSGASIRRDLPAQVKATGHDGQFPIASVISCIDSRAAPSHVFDQGIGDLFTARVAGNIVNEDILGSLEYGSKVAGAKLVVVLGHTHCGAVKGACDKVALGNLTALLDKIQPAVKVTPDTHGTDRSSKNHHFVDAVAKANVHMTVARLLQQSPVLRAMHESGEIKVVGAMLDVETGRVQFY